MREEKEDKTQEYGLFDSFWRTLIIVTVTSTAFLHLVALRFNEYKPFFLFGLFLMAFPHVYFPLLYVKEKMQKSREEQRTNTFFSIFVNAGLLILCSFGLTIVLFSVFSDVLNYNIIPIISLFFSLAQLISIPFFACGFIILSLIYRKKEKS